MGLNIVFACLICGQADDHPKHVIALQRDVEIRHHHDCGALMNPPCEVCKVLVGEAPKKAGAAKGAVVPVTGEDMRAHLISLPPREWTHHPDGSVSYVDLERDADGTPIPSSARPAAATESPEE